MTKKELIEEILKVDSSYSNSKLTQMKLSDLEVILKGLTAKKVVEEAVESKEKPVSVKKKIDRDTVVPCRNLTSGKLTYISKKSGMETVWSAFGDEEYLDIAELLTMKASQPKFLKEPWLLVDDSDAVEYLGLKELYKTIIPIEEVEEFFQLHLNDARKILPNLPKGMKTLIGEMARKGIENETLNNVQLIKLLEQELHLELISLMD